MASRVPLRMPYLHHALLMFIVSGTVLAYEILLMRLLSVAQWYHFASMVISVALLGLGAAGSLLFLTYHHIQKRIDTALVFLTGLTAASLPLGFSLSQRTGLDSLRLLWQYGEWFSMGWTYVMLSIPFLLSGAMIGILLTAHGERACLIYGVNLLGSGFGALAVVPCLYLAPPWSLLPILGGILLCGALWPCLLLQRPLTGILWISMAAVLLVAIQVLLPPLPRIHPTKPLPMTLSLPDARIEARKTGPLGMIHVVGSSHIRYVPGLSLRFGLEEREMVQSIPEQKALFIDGDALSPVARFRGARDELAYQDYTTMALPYFVRRPQRVLVIGAGGGSDILLGIRHDIPDIVALEMNRQITELMRGPLATFSGSLYDRPEVSLRIEEARRFLYRETQPFDLIQLSLLDSFGASAGGLYAASENYLYTTEAFSLYLSRLSDSGILAVTRWLKLPPRDTLRIISTALHALRRIGLHEGLARHLMVIRSWKTSTILISRSPFLQEEILRSEGFCEERNFDTVFYPGMPESRANRYDVQEEPIYYRGTKALLSPEAEAFQRRYLFDISPTRDDRPYFSHFFRWDKTRKILRQLGREALPRIDLGYLLLLATLTQAGLAGIFLILLPLFFLGRLSAREGGMPMDGRFFRLVGLLFYFGAIGVGFMFIEMALLPKFTLLFSHPTYSAAIVLCGVLIFAGLGSLYSSRFPEGAKALLWIAFAVVLAWTLGLFFLGEPLMGRVMALSFEARVVWGLSLLAVPSFFLGWPFPVGLLLTARKTPRLIPWAWGVNGCASVIGAVLGKCLAMTLGFTCLMGIACGLYLGAVVVYQRILSRDARSPRGCLGTLMGSRQGG